MNHRRPRAFGFSLALLLAAAPRAFGAGTTSPPPPAGPPVVFSRDVLPIFAHRCYDCHANGKAKGGLDVGSRDALIKGGKNGPAIIARNGGESLLVTKLTLADPDERMPNKGDPLSPDEVAVVRRWVDQGAVWDAPAGAGGGAVIAGKPRVEPRAVALPAGEGNPIDRLLAEYLARHGIKAGEVVNDRRFARRAFFDLIGLPPTPAELAAFARDGSPEKRANLADALLARRDDYAEHWMSFWCDHLRSGTTFGIDGKNININGWLLPALRDNMPYDRFVRTLINPGKDGPGGFVEGLKMRGVVETSARTELQAAQNISQVFLGTQIKCATCHDSFTSKWTQAELWGMASVYADEPMEIARCEKPTGKMARPAFLFPEVGEIDPALPKPQRMARLAELVTDPRDGLLSRTIVNRLWARLMGRGLVEPVDNLENPAWAPDVLDWLANDLVASGYDVKHTLRLIVTSRAYQMPATDDGELRTIGPRDGSKYVFGGPRFRRLSAEQYADATCAVGGPGVLWGDLTSPPPKPTAAKPDPKNEHKLGRAWTHTRSALQEALGRPDRNNVMTVRDTDASTLQALQVLSGKELNGVVDKLAGKLIAESPAAEGLTKLVFARALCREPRPNEMHLAREVLGDKPTVAAAADLLWLVIALPEFQVID